MKKYLFTIAAVALALCACQKTETGNNEVSPGAKEEVGTPQQILIGTNLNSSELLTKASVDYWNGQTVYVLGYDNAKIGTATEVTADAGFVMPNTPGTVPTNSEYSEAALKGLLNFGETTKFYYDESVQSYDFVGYYLGEGTEGTPIAGTPAVASGVLTVPFTIDGNQDVLAAITDIDNDRVFTDDSGARKAVVKDYVYSAFASRRGVTPTLIFNHMLTKFTFNVTFGSEDGASAFHLGTISLGTPTEGDITLNPAGRVTPFVTATGEEGTVTRDASFVSFTDGEGGQGPVEAGCLMVLPGKSEYQMTLTYEQDDTDGEKHEYNVPIEIDKVKWFDDQQHPEITEFQAGKHYVVNVTVYGLEKIEVSVELVPWDEVGFVEIDPDDPEGKIEGVEPTE